MSNHEIPQLGRNLPAILGSDSRGEIKRKIDDYLPRLREAFEERHQEAVETGEAAGGNYVPSCNVTVTVAYDGPRSAGNLISNASQGLIDMINALPEHDFFLLDVEEWQRVNLTLDHGETPSPYGYTIGVQYLVRVADNRGLENYQQRAATEWNEAARKFDSGELVTHSRGSVANGGELEAMLRALAGQNGGDNIH